MQAHLASSLAATATTTTTTTTTAAASASGAYALNQGVTYPQAISNNNNHTTSTAAVASTNTTLAATSDSVSEPVQAYAKLEGDSFSYYIRTLQVTFGRKASSSDQVDIHLGPTKAISRQHARLFYNFTTQRFEMMVFGKNGAFVNDQFVEKGVTVPLENRTKIQIGEVSFSFLLPKLESDDHTQDATTSFSSSSSSSGQTSTQKGAASGTGFHKAAPTVKKEIIAGGTTSTSGDASGDSKPPFSYASLIAQAINATPSRKLTLNGIYQHITTHYPYYQMSQNGWQNSIRHNLSLNKAFVKVPRSDSEPGKGAFWTIDQSCDAQFANGVYKRSRRATSSKPGSRPVSDSESSFDQSDKPRKRVNTGPEDGSSLDPSRKPVPTSTLASQTTSVSSQLQIPDASQINEASLKLATLLQRNPGMLALNLAALSQSLAAAHKEGIPSALLNGLMAAAKASAEQGGGAASIAETARVLAAHLQQQPAVAVATGSTSKPTTPPPTTMSSAQQSLAAIQAIAASRANVTPLPTTVLASTSPAALATVPTTSSTTTTSPTIAAPASALASPIAQLVAAAQAQAAAQAKARAANAAPVAVPAPAASATATSVPSPLPSSLETTIIQAQAKALALVQAHAQAQTQAQAQIQAQAQAQSHAPTQKPAPQRQEGAPPQEITEQISTTPPSMTETPKPLESAPGSKDDQQI